MRGRVIFLLCVLVLRIGFNVWSVHTSKHSSHYFESVKIHQSGTECFIEDDYFSVKSEKNCQLESGLSYRISGSHRSNLIDMVLGRIWLDEPTIIRVIKSEKTQLSLFDRLVNYGLIWRNELSKIASRHLTDPEASLVVGIVLGHKSNLSANFYEKLKKSGTVHVVVASGYNVMIVANFVLGLLLNFLKRRLATIFGLLFVIGYVFLSGAEISIIRASLMAFVVLWGSAIGRKSQAWWSLSLVVVALFVIQPTIVLDISFQLSVLATVGVAILGPFLHQKMIGSDMLFSGLLVKTELISTFSAVLLTWPVIWFHFGEGSPMAIFSNALILPLVPITMMLGTITLLLGVLFPPLASIFSLPTYAVSHLMVVLINWFGSI